jgi:hypothetical protein
MNPTARALARRQMEDAMRSAALWTRVANGIRTALDDVVATSALVRALLHR